MTKFVKGALFVGVVSLAFGSVASAQPAEPAVNAIEFKCMTAASKSASKFVKTKAKCAGKCITNAGKLLNPYSDCFAPYGGTTLTCITEPTFRKGAEEKFEDAIRKGCDPTFKAGTDCPSCYSNGDCTAEAGDRVQNIEGQVDSFGPGVFCEQPGADALESKCEQNTAKTLAKLVGSINKCYEKCNGNARKALNPFSDCAPPGAGTTATCVSAAENKAILGVNKKCGDVGAIPDCAVADDYPTGSSWVVLVSSAISGNVPGTFCASPSGAFID